MGTIGKREISRDDTDCPKRSEFIDEVLKRRGSLHKTWPYPRRKAKPAEQEKRCETA
jgi:hypothetical protein